MVYTHGRAPGENQAEEEPPAVGQRYLGRLLTCSAPVCLQEHYGSLLPEGLQQRPSTGVQPWAEARQRWCQGKNSTHMQMVSLTAAEWWRANCESPTLKSCLRKGMSQGVFYSDVRGPASGLWFGLNQEQTNSNYGAIFLPYTSLGIIPNLSLFLFHLFFCPCECNQTKPLTELFPRAPLPKSTSLILLTSYLIHPHYLHRLQVLRQHHCHTTGTVLTAADTFAAPAVNDPFYW